jgi:predicted enzyme related to lactoylglutathione lyase
MAAPIVYFEVAGPDGAALQAFYSNVFQWDINAQRTISAATAGIRGGIRQDPPATVFYLGVDDVNAAQDAIVAAGGTTIIRRMAVPGVVTFGLFKDPAGNVCGLAENGSIPTSS